MRTALRIGWIAVVAILLAAPQGRAQSYCVTCYPNCDGSTGSPVLTGNDFQCFLNAYVAGSALPPAQQVTHYANCDGSTGTPAITGNDFQCFLDRYTAGCPTLQITPSSGGLGTTFTLTLSNTSLAFDSGTSASWTGKYTPSGGTATSAFSVTFNASQFREQSGTEAKLVLGDGSFSNAPNVSGLAGSGVLNGQLIITFSGGQTHYQCISISVNGDASQWRSVSYLSAPTSPNAAVIGGVVSQIPLFAISEFANAAQISQEALIAAKEYHLAPVVLLDDNTQSSAGAPSSLSVDLVAFSSNGTEVSRVSGVQLARLGSPLVSGKIGFAPDLTKPILLIDTALTAANYPGVRLLRGVEGGTVSIVPQQ